MTNTLLQLTILPFDIQFAVVSGMAIAAKDDSGSDNSLVNVVKMQLRLEQDIK